MRSLRTVPVGQSPLAMSFKGEERKLEASRSVGKDKKAAWGALSWKRVHAEGIWILGRGLGDLCSGSRSSEFAAPYEFSLGTR